MSKQKTPAWETIAIFGAIFALWPAVLRYWAGQHTDIDYTDLPLGKTINWAHGGWDILMYIALALMVFIAVRRVRRVRTIGRETDDSDGIE